MEMEPTDGAFPTTLEMEAVLDTDDKRKGPQQYRLANWVNIQAQRHPYIQLKPSARGKKYIRSKFQPPVVTKNFIFMFDSSKSKENHIIKNCQFVVKTLITKPCYEDNKINIQIK